MGTILKAILALVVAAALYLSFWPVPVDPVAWEPPEDQGYTGNFVPNSRLADIERMSLGGDYGPEDLVANGVGDELMLYASSHSGTIYEINPRTLEVMPFTDTGGIPLGMEFDANGSLIVADAHRGLLSVAPDGAVSVLTNTVDGTSILYADDLGITPAGVIYFSDASTKFGAEDFSSPLEASLYEIVEHGRTGRILAYDPEDRTTRTVIDGLSFANGVAISSDGGSILYLETGEYSLTRLDLASGETTPILTNLPGYPDNINRGPDLEDGTPTYLIGLVGPRAAIIDDLASNTFMRKVILRLPGWMQPAPTQHSFVAQITETGDVLQTWQDPAGGFISTTGGLVPGDGYLYVTSVASPDLGRVPY